MRVQEEQVTITLQELNSLGQHQPFQVAFSSFAIYLSANSKFNTHGKLQELMTLDSHKIPYVPIRRVSCSQCVTNNLACQMCHKCMNSGVVCCRNIACMYQMRSYLSDKESNIYKRCKCTEKYQASTQQFAIDWRMVSLLSRMNNINLINYNYNLHFQAGILWITEHTLDQEGKSHKISRTFFQQNLDPHPELINQQSLQSHNIRHLSNLLKERVKTNLSYKQDWDISNLQEACNEVIENLLADRGLEQLKISLQENNSNLPNPYISGKPLRSLLKLTNCAHSSSLVSQANFKSMSRAVNQYLSFYYRPSQELLFVKNAKYYRTQQQSNIKAYPVKQNTSLQNAIWFKDRKGDIFAIHNDTISIFKYNMDSKGIQQIIMKNDQRFINVRHSQALVYIAQIDRVYYFDSRLLSQSFYFDLYRLKQQQSQFSNCVSVNTLHTISFESQIKRFDSFFRATYFLEYNSKKNPVSIIYLLGYKKNYLPLPLCLLKITHSELRQVNSQEILPTQGQLFVQIASLDFQNGVHTVFKRNRCVIIAFMGQINGKLMLAEGKIIHRQKKPIVQWNLHSLSLLSPKISELSIETPRRQAQKNKKTALRSVEPYQQEKAIILSLTDLNGFQTNNTTRYLSFLPKQNRCVELILSLNEGKYTLNMFNAY